MFSDAIYEIKQKLQNPLKELTISDQKKVVGQIVHANYSRLKYLLYFLSIFSVLLLASDIYYFDSWSNKDLFTFFLLADISLFLISVTGLFIIYGKRLPSVDFQQRMFYIYVLYGAVWIGLISGMDYQQSYVTLVAGIFVISNSFILQDIFHGVVLLAIYVVAVVMVLPQESQYFDAFTEFFIIPACMMLAWIFGKVLYKHKVESIQKENKLREYADNLQDVVDNRTTELKKKNENLIREINSKETIQNQLIASEELFKKLLYQSADAIAIFEIEGQIVHWNGTTEEYTGIKRRDAIDKVFWDIIQIPEEYKTESMEFKEKVQTYVDQVAENVATTSQIKVRHRVKNNSNRERFLETKVFPIYLHNRTLIAAIGRDITQQFEYEKHLKDARIKAERANTAKSDFLANISHDLRSPLNSIAGFSQILKLKPEIQKQKRNRYLSIIYDNGQYLLQLINGLIDLTQLQSGNIKIESQAFYLQDFKREVESIITSEKTLRSPNIKIVHDCEEKNLMLRTDRTKLLQIYTNLLSNALKFTDKGQVAYGCKVLGSHLYGFVEDTGAGIDDPDLQQIFNRFFRVNDRSERNKQGKGLGLAIVKGYVDLLDGKISVKSEKGKGTRFDLQIPVEVMEVENIKGDTTMPTPGKKILVVDKDAESAEFVCELLNQYKLEVNRVSLLEEVDELIEIQKPDLLLLDVFRDNEALYNRISVIREKNPGLPVIVYTALPQVDITERLSGMVDVVIFKPINANVLIQKAAKLINGRRKT